MTINLFRGRITALLVAASFFVVPAATAQQPESSAPASQMESTDTLILTVENAVNIALNDNYSIKIADEDIKRVDYLEKENWYALLPSLNAGGQYTNNILKPVFFTDFAPGGKMEVGFNNSFAVSAALELPLLSMSLYKNIQLSQIEMQSALESARSTKLDLIMQVKNTFYGIIVLEESNRVLSQSYKNALESAQNIADMYANGMASEYDKIRSEVATRNIVPALTQSQTSLKLAKMQLKVLLSIDVAIPIKALGSFAQFEDEIRNYQPDYSCDLGMNSDLRQLDIQTSKLNKSLQLIRSQRVPTIGLFGNYNIQMQSNKFTVNEPWANAASVGLSVSIPIFNKMSIYMKAKQTKVGIQQMEYQKNLATQSLIVSVNNSVNQMAVAKIQLESDKEAVAQAQKGYEIAKVRYNTGIGTVLELNDSEVALTTSQMNLNQTLYNFLQAKNQMEKVLGTIK